MQTNITYYAVLLMLTRSIGCVVADYVVQVHLQSYSNPTNRAHSQSGACCDSQQAKVCNGNHRCDNYFSFCLRPLDTPAQQRVCDETTRIVSAFAANDDAFINFNQPTVLGRPNPLNLSVSGPRQGVQLYIEVYDRDYGPNNQDDFIDSFAVNVYYSSAGTSLVNTLGTYGYGMISLTASTLCAQFSYGDQCQYVDKCQRDSITCSGRGSCNIIMNTHICVCDPGYTGTDCEVNINECKDQRCNGNGECIDGVNEYRCACKSGYTGAECEINIDECENKNCSGHGQCVDEVNSYDCVCDPGYTGTDCEVNINECEHQRCSRNGRCIDDVNMYNCARDPGFTGIDCETEINECDYQNCSGYGQCKDAVNSYSCICDPGFTGTDCETEINECDYQNCSEHGQCTDEVNSYSCDCLVGFWGNNCEHIDHCFGVNCSGNGRCELRENGFTCNCTLGFAGELCKEVMQSKSLIEAIAGGITAAVFMMILITVLLIVLIVYLTRKRADHKVSDGVLGDNPVYEIPDNVQQATNRDDTASSTGSETAGFNNAIYGSGHSINEADIDNHVYEFDHQQGQSEPNDYETPVPMYDTVEIEK